jgi:hypothetical protein
MDSETSREIWISKNAAIKLNLIPKAGDLIQTVPGAYGNERIDQFEVRVVNTPSWFITYGTLFEYQLVCDYLRPGIVTIIEP